MFEGLIPDESAIQGLKDLIGEKETELFNTYAKEIASGKRDKG